MVNNIVSCVGRLLDASPTSIELQELSPNTYRVIFEKNKDDYKLRIENDRNNRRTLLRNEAVGLRLLEEHRLDIAHPRLLTLDHDPNGRLFSLQTYISGEPIVNIDSEIVRHYKYTRIGCYLKHIHDIHRPLCGRLANPKKLPWRENFFNHLSNDVEESKAVLPTSLANDIYNLASKTLYNVNFYSKFLHGDPHPGNMIIGTDYVAMIDFHHCLFGDPLFEVAQFYVRASRYEKDPQKAMEALLSGLEPKPFNINLIRVYVLALFINEIAFSFRIGKQQRKNFYQKKLLDYWHKKGGN